MSIGEITELIRLCGIVTIVFQDTAEAMFAFDLAWIKWNDIVIIVVRFPARQGQQVIVEALMRPTFIIIVDVLGNDAVDVLLAENYLVGSDLDQAYFPQENCPSAFQDVH